MEARGRPEDTVMGGGINCDVGREVDVDVVGMSLLPMLSWFRGGGGAFFMDDVAYCLEEFHHGELRNMAFGCGVCSKAGVRW